MSIHFVVSCVLLLAHSSLSDNTIFSEVGKHATEERVDKTTVYDFQEEKYYSNASKPSLTQSSDESNTSSSEENNIKENVTNISSSESVEGSSSDEEAQRKSIQKRSLDSKQDSVNSIGKISNQTTKISNDLEKNTSDVLDDTNSEVQNSTTVKDVSASEVLPESKTQDSDPSTKLLPETTTELVVETTIITTDTEITTTESEREATSETEIEMTTEVSSKGESTVSENKSQTEPETLSETEPKATTETNTSPNASSEKTESSTEENEEETLTISSSTTPTELISPKPKEEKENSFFEVAMQRVNKLSDQIRLVLIHYRKVGVVVLPGQSFFPDPMTMQDFRQSFSIGTMDFKSMNVYGLSNFTVQHINTDVDRMQVYILLHMKRLVILGNYTLRTFFSRAAGPFNVTLLDVDSEGVAEIETAPEGHLEATDSVMDMFTKDMRVDFRNLGFMGSMFQGMVSTVGDALFNSIKPQILERVNLVIRTDVNKKLKEFSTKFINKVNPVDLAFSEGRKYCRTHGYDPYHIKDHTFILGGLVFVNITDFWVEGLSKFYKVGNLSLSMDAGVIEIGVHVMTGKLTGHCHWSGQTFGIAKYGKTNFTVDHLQVRALVNQSLDIRKKPQLEDLDLELGWVKVTMDSPMTLNLMIEGIINAFPRLIRHIIVDTLEQPLKEKIQEILNKINVESIVDENLPRLDSFGL